MSWYRQYRPTTVGQLHLVSVRQTLQDMMQSGNFPHAFLFAGPKGTGKTSSARIIAAILNDPLNSSVVDKLFFDSAPGSQSKKKTEKVAKTAFQEPNQSDELVQRIQRGSSYVVSELDAASNRGIDDIRQLKERIFLPPQEGKVSVYILDEAHMLTTEAFNALLKILEEPPLHVVFILATTELQKIPDTIISRCAVIRFHKASQQELTEAMEQILGTEQITFEVEALQQLAQLADGSFRDAVKLLEMVAKGKKRLTNEDIQQIAEGTQQAQIQTFLQAVVEKQEQQVVQFFIELRKKGSDPKFFYGQLLAYLHQQLITAITVSEEKTQFSTKISHYLLNQFATLTAELNGSIPFLGLELKALEIIFKAKEKNNPTLPTKTTLQPKQPITLEIQASPKEETFITQPIAEQPSTFVHVDAAQVLAKWDDFLAKVRQKNSSIEALLRSSKPYSEGDKTKIEVYYQFHREQLQQPKFRSLLDECSQELFGGPVPFEFLLADSAKPGAQLSTVSGKVEEETLIQLAKEILV